jgi:DNA-binding protein H-NS
MRLNTVSIDLKSMSRKELEKHLAEVKKALQSAQARDRREAKRAAEKAVAEFGLSLSDITEEGKPQPKQKKTKQKSPARKSKPKYANPTDPTQTWTGKGRQPNWFKNELDKGTPAERMEIK